MSAVIHPLANRVAPHISGAPVAAAVFRPNYARPMAGGGLPGLIGVVVSWHREDRAILEEGGLAPRTLLVVTTADVHAFDAGLLSWKAVVQIAAWPRADLVARIVPVAGPIPPRWAEFRYRPPPSLRLENRAGELLAQLQAETWGTASKRVVAELTGETPD